MQARYDMLAAAAEVGIARGNRFPSIALTAKGGAASNSIKGLTSANPWAWDALGSLTLPVFNFGRLRRAEQAAMERYTQSALTYEQLEQDTNGDWWISGNRQKTETKYVVKLLPYPLFLLDKYRGLAGNRYLFKLSSLDSIDDSLKNIARECGIDKQLSFHLARHTYATTICLSNGVSLETLSKMLGHKNITTTQIYARAPRMVA